RSGGAEALRRLRSRRVHIDPHRQLYRPPGSPLLLSSSASQLLCITPLLDSRCDLIESLCKPIKLRNELLSLVRIQLTKFVCKRTDTFANRVGITLCFPFTERSIE